MTKVTIASRGSALARWQAGRVQQLLEKAGIGLAVSVRVVHTTGDRVRDVPLSRIGGRGLFTREVDRALLAHEADMAVHSLKDLPTVWDEGLELAAVLEREDPRDALVVAPDRPPFLEKLARGARVGTSSLRRRALLLHQRPDLHVEDLRGNLDTRLERVAAGEYDAAVLAMAGILRLGREEALATPLADPDWLPAAGQGALAVVIRAGDERARELLVALDDVATRAATEAERSFLHELEGGCQVPIGALATVSEGELSLDGLVASLDGRTLIRDRIEGPADQSVQLGGRLAAVLRNRGAEDILGDIRQEEAQNVSAASPP